MTEWEQTKSKFEQVGREHRQREHRQREHREQRHWEQGKHGHWEPWLQQMVISKWEPQFDDHTGESKK